LRSHHPSFLVPLQKEGKKKEGRRKRTNLNLLTKLSPRPVSLRQEVLEKRKRRRKKKKKKGGEKKKKGELCPLRYSSEQFAYGTVYPFSAMITTCFLSFPLGWGRRIEGGKKGGKRGIPGFGGCIPSSFSHCQLRSPPEEGERRKKRPISSGDGPSRNVPETPSVSRDHRQLNKEERNKKGKKENRHRPPIRKIEGNFAVGSQPPSNYRSEGQQG